MKSQQKKNSRLSQEKAIKSQKNRIQSVLGDLQSKKKRTAAIKQWTVINISHV